MRAVCEPPVLLLFRANTEVCPHPRPLSRKRERGEQYLSDHYLQGKHRGLPLQFLPFTLFASYFFRLVRRNFSEGGCLCPFLLLPFALSRLPFFSSFSFLQRLHQNKVHLTSVLVRRGHCHTHTVAEHKFVSCGFADKGYSGFVEFIVVAVQSGYMN